MQVQKVRSTGLTKSISFWSGTAVRALGNGLFDIEQKKKAVARFQQPRGPPALKQWRGLKGCGNCERAPLGGPPRLSPYEVESAAVCRRVSAVPQELPQRSLVMKRFARLPGQHKQGPGVTHDSLKDLVVVIHQFLAE